MKDGKFDLKTFLDNIELYISAVLFIALTVLLFANVFCRYALKHSFAWVEEVATIAFVWMIWFAMSAAVTKRKHLRIDFILEASPADGILHHSYRAGAQRRKNRTGYHKTHA